MREILETEFCFVRNKDEHISGAVSRLKNYLKYEVFDKCCSIQKQIQAGLPDEQIIDNFNKL